MPPKRPPMGLSIDAPPPVEKAPVQVTSTMTLVVMGSDGTEVRVKEDGIASTPMVGGLQLVTPPTGTAAATSGPSPRAQPTVTSLLDKVRFDDLKLCEEIGRGSQGKVRRVQNRLTKEFFALKSMTLGEDVDATRAQLHQELTRIAAVRHPNVVSSIEAYFREGKLYILMELMDCGTMASVLKRQRCGFSYQIVSYIAKHFFRGLAHLHASGVIHRDIKPANLLCNQQGEVKISDFGVAGTGGSKLHQTGVGSTPYMSPERVKNEGYSESCDVWSAGLTLAELCLGEYPLGNKSNIFELCQRIANCEAQIDWPRATGTTSPELIDFVAQCMHPAATRPSAARMLEHPFMRQGDDLTAAAVGAFFANPGLGVPVAGSAPGSAVSPSSGSLASTAMTPASAVSLTSLTDVIAGQDSAVSPAPARRVVGFPED